MEPTEYAQRLEELALDIQKVRNEAEELFEHTPRGELEQGAHRDIMEEVHEISEMLRDDLDAALERAERVSLMAEMMLMVHGD